MEQGPDERSEQTMERVSSGSGPDPVPGRSRSTGDARHRGSPHGPGDSGPGQPGYGGQTAIGEEGASAWHASTEPSEARPAGPREPHGDEADELVDKASADSFPASDPPAASSPVA